MATRNPQMPPDQVGKERIESEPMTEKERAAYDVSQLIKAWHEALDRLEAADGDGSRDLIMYTHSEHDPEKVVILLEQNEASLSEEAKFFLRTTVYLRRARVKYKELFGFDWEPEYEGDSEDDVASL